MKHTLRLVMKTITGDAPFLSAIWLRRSMFLLQFLFGLLWIQGASWKIIVDGKLGFNYNGLAYWVGLGSKYPVLEPYKVLIDTVLLPNIMLFLPLVFLIELTIGVLFISGKYIRIAALLAMAQTTAIALSVIKAPSEWGWSYILMFIVAVIFFINPTISQWKIKRNKT